MVAAVSSEAAEKKDLLVRGHRIVYLHAGAGEPLLLTHGITTYSFIWQKLIPRLAERYEIFAPDLLGCGDSDKPLTESYALTAHAERLLDFARSLGLERFHYIGHDLGGGIGQIMAVREPERFIDLSLINTVGYDFWPVQPIIAMRTPIVRQFMMASLDFGTFQLIVRRGLYHKEHLTPELMEQFTRPMRTSEGRKAFLHFAHCLDNRNLQEIADRLTQLPMPVLIVRGSADPFLSAAIADRLNRDIPHSQLVHIRTGSHFLMEDEPGQLGDILINFLTQQRD